MAISEFCPFSFIYYSCSFDSIHFVHRSQHMCNSQWHVITHISSGVTPSKYYENVIHVVVCPVINGLHEFLRLRLLSLVSLGFHPLEQRLVEKARLLVADVAPLWLLGAFMAVAAVDSFARTILMSVPKKQIKIMLISTSSKCSLFLMAPLSVNYMKQLRKGHPLQTKSAWGPSI